MNRSPVDSSMIVSVGWEASILEVEFCTNGSIYHYYGVGIDLFQQLRVADSVGKFFIANIKNLFPYSRIK